MQKQGDDEQCLQGANFSTAKFRRLRKCENFRNLGNSQAKFGSPSTGTPATTQDQKL